MKRLVALLVAVCGIAFLISVAVPFGYENQEVIVRKSYLDRDAIQHYVVLTLEDNTTFTFTWEKQHKLDPLSFHIGDRLKLHYSLYLLRRHLDDVRRMYTHDERLHMITHTVYRPSPSRVEITYEDPLNETVFVHFKIRLGYPEDVIWEFRRYDSTFLVTYTPPNRWNTYYYTLQFKLKYEETVYEQRGILYGSFS